MDNIVYTSIGPVLHLNKAGELTQKRMKAAKLCDGLYITEPDKSGYTQFICELDGVVWLDCKAAESRIADGIKLAPGYFDNIKAGALDGENIPAFKREISRRINHPDSPAIMELKKPERKKSAPLPEGAKKVGVIMFKGCTDEMTDKKVIINEVAPHVYTYTYKLKRYGERVKIIFEIDGVYFQGADNGAYVMEREDFNEICAKAYERARENVADGAAKGMRYFVEVQKRIDAATSSEEAQTDDTDAAITLPNEDINYMFYIKPKGAKRFSTYNPGKGTMNTGRVFTELYRKEHLPAVCKWIAEDMSGDFAYQLRSGDGKRIYWQHNPTAATTAETPQIPTETTKTANVSTKEEKTAEMPQILNCEWQTVEHFKAIPNIAKLTNAGIIINGVAWHTEYLDQSYNVLARVDNIGWHEDGKGFGGFRGSGVFGKTEIFENWDDAVIATIEALTAQSPETPQRTERTIDTPKRRETARKEQKRTIPKMERVHAREKSGAQGYSMLADASATLAAINVPPIRGDCKIGISTRAKPPNSTLYKKISILQPP